MPDTDITPEAPEDGITPESALEDRLQAIKAMPSRELSTPLPDLDALQTARDFEPRQD